MEKAAKKLQNRNAKQRERDNRDHVKQLHKQGFSLAEIASITRLDHKEIYDLVHSKRKDDDLFDDCPEEIMADLGEVFDF
jgi:TRAP-type C4-dicarboxylate transport system substrate-binding protein